MCGRFTLTAPPDRVRDIFEIKRVPDYSSRYNVAPTQDVLAVRPEAEDGAEVEAVMMRWGLVPFWADDLRMSAKMINARSETVSSKPAFRDAFVNRRCLIVADGFIEWQRIGREKQPFWFRLRNEEPFAFAGLWERWRDTHGLSIETCTILTTDANELVAGVHDRMPVILPRDVYADWLDHSVDSKSLRELLVPLPGDLMRKTPISPRVNNVANDDEACLAPTEVQGSLF